MNQINRINYCLLFICIAFNAGYVLCGYELVDSSVINAWPMILCESSGAMESTGMCSQQLMDSNNTITTVSIDITCDNKTMNCEKGLKTSGHSRNTCIHTNPMQCIVNNNYSLVNTGVEYNPISRACHTRLQVRSTAQVAYGGLGGTGSMNGTGADGVVHKTSYKQINGNNNDLLEFEILLLIICLIMGFL